MGYTVEEIRGLTTTAYEKLGSTDAMAEHSEELNQLTYEEKVNLASFIVLQCPASDLKSFHYLIEAAKTRHEEAQPFHAILAETYEVKSRLNALLDVKHTQPHNLFLDEEYDEVLFNTYKGLALQILDKNESKIAERLALTTPADRRNELAVNLKGIFPNTLLATKVGHAFAVRRDIDRLLLGEHPEQFFTSRDFSVDSCLEFAGLFQTLLKGHEQEIGIKLALASNANLAIINRKLEMINSTAHDQTNPFRLIADAMTKESVKQENPSKQAVKGHASSPHILFNGSSDQRAKTALAPLTYDEDDSDEEEDSCWKKICSFLS